MPSTRREGPRTPDWRSGEGALPPGHRAGTRLFRFDRSAVSEAPSIDDPLKGLPAAQQEMADSRRIRVRPRERSRLRAHHVAPDRVSHSWRMPPENPVSATAHATTETATTAVVTPATHAPNQRAATDIAANTAV